MLPLTAIHCKPDSWLLCKIALFARAARSAGADTGQKADDDDDDDLEDFIVHDAEEEAGADELVETEQDIQLRTALEVRRRATCCAVWLGHVDGHGCSLEYSVCFVLQC